MKVDPSLANVSNTCKSCGNHFKGLYCNLCGEKILESKDKTFRSFLGSVLITITFADSKFIKTLWLTLKNPGFLSKEYANGRRVMYLRPLQLFFILNLIYFLFPVLQLFNSSLYTQMYLLLHSPLVRPLVLNHILTHDFSMDGYALMYNEKTTSLAKLLIVAFVILASLPLALIYRKKNRYFADHMVLSVEVAAFNLLVNAILLSILLWLVSKFFVWSNSGWKEYLNDTTLSIIFVTTNVYFLFRAARTFYGQTGKRQIIKVALGLVGLFLALEAYRLILFFVTFWSL
ncbi:MAG: DUF3667 domain-containing protein [Flammeovirgaceae bacterium]|nr:DUF3667 domain-containing protein [Flammeovirgaceae bacterium]